MKRGRPKEGEIQFFKGKQRSRSDYPIVILKKRTIVACLLAVLVIAGAVCAVCIPTFVAAKNMPRIGITVVIDAGHGGIDGGVVGVKSKTKEADVNLEIAKLLKSDFETAGVEVIMTRTTANGLYGLSTNGYKQRDMKARSKIIADSNPDLVISIHQNSFPVSSERGAQAFFRAGSEQSHNLAKAVQRMFSLNLPASNREALKGDYYMLNCNDRPAVLVECGFLSNPEDEALLLDDNYREKVAYQIFLGSMLFLNVEKL